MSETAEKIVVKVKVTNDVKRWNHFSLTQNGKVKNIFLVFDMEGEEVYIQYDTVALCVDGEIEEYELTHEEEIAVIDYIVSHYGH